MTNKTIQMAICYDFDGTLSPKNMQEYAFMERLKADPDDFWAKCSKIATEQNADTNLTYMKLMLDEARHNNLPFNKKAFVDFGKSVELFNGVEGWFKRINEYGNQHNITIKHYIISSGLKEIIEATSIGNEFESIFASSFMYDANDVASWPANAVNYTSKTQYIFRINKGCCDINDHAKINEYIKQAERDVPFSNMVFIGDGATDIPSMKMVKINGGHSIAVYNSAKDGAKEKASKLIAEDRVNIIANADYSENTIIDKYIKALIDKIKADNVLDSFTSS